MKLISELPQLQELQTQLKERKRTVVRFRFPYPKDVVYNMLLASCEVEVNHRFRQFIPRKEFLDHIMEVAEFLTSTDSRFGLFLCGTKGNGKTTLSQALISLIEYCRTQDDYNGDGRMSITITAKELVLLSKAYNNPTRDNCEAVYKYKYLCKIPFLAIDDLGTEPSSSKHYGDYVTAAIDILRTRYDDQLFTIATSNLPAGDIKSYYDELIADRFKEMMKIINYGEEPSFR